MSQLSNSAVADNGFSTVITVSSGVVFYLNTISWVFWDESGAGGLCRIELTDSTPARVYDFARISLPADGYIAGNVTFPKGLQVPADYLIRVYSAAADLKAFGYAHGFEW